MESNTKILNHIIQLCFNAKEYKLLNEQIVLLSKKHGLLKTVKRKILSLNSIISFIKILNKRNNINEFINILLKRLLPKWFKLQ